MVIEREREREQNGGEAEGRVGGGVGVAWTRETTSEGSQS